MSERKLYELTDGEVDLLKTALHFSKAPQNLKDDLTATLTPLGPDAAVERMARAIAVLEPGEPWPTNEELGGGPTGTRDDEYRHDCMDRARAALDALLQEDE